jgi:hypothetical protein
MENNNKNELLESVAFILFLESWEYDGGIAKIKNHTLENLKNTWLTTWMPSLTGLHFGRCGSEDTICLRCKTEKIFKDAARIVDLMSTNTSLKSSYNDILSDNIVEKMPAFDERYKIAEDNFGIKADNENGNYIHIDHAMDVLHRSLEIQVSFLALSQIR